MFARISKQSSRNCLLVSMVHLFSVRVRYAPSPTGFMHIGGLRTALFNYLFARKLNGKFILRIEDTDKNRQVPGSVDNIFQALEWIGINPDQSLRRGGQHSPYIQSERLQLYKSIEKQLLKSNMAYPCFCKRESKNQAEQNEVEPPYDRRCRSIPFAQIKQRIKNKQEYAVRIKSDLMALPKTFHDEVFGELEFKPLDDFVIVRTNGWPTFHFASVIDDWKMGITHVMRGEEWLTNTNKHVYLYSVLGLELPKFVHLPLIKAMNGKKLAKRDPESAVKWFQTGKYEVEAVKCFLAQMGLNRALPNPQKQEEENSQKKRSPPPTQKQGTKSKRPNQQDLKLMTDAEMVANFDISRITKVPVKFDIKQLDYLNRLSIKKRWKLSAQMPSEQQYFINKVHQLIPASLQYSQSYIVKFLGSVVDRFTFITDIVLYRYYFEQPDYLDEKAKQDFQKIYGKQATLAKKDTFSVTNYDPLLYQHNRKIIHNLRILLQHVIEPKGFTELEIAKKISELLCQSPDLKNEEVFHLLRFAVTGRRSGPNITLACQIIGRDRILARMALFSTL